MALVSLFGVGVFVVCVFVVCKEEGREKKNAEKRKSGANMLGFYFFVFLGVLLFEAQ